MLAEEFFASAFQLKDRALISTLARASAHRHIQQGRMLLREGEIQSEMLFLVSGIIRGFYFDVDGHEITDCFAVQTGMPLAAGADFEKPSPMYMDALVDSDLLSIPTQDVRCLLNQYPELLQLYNRLLVNAFSMHWEIKTTLCRSTAMQRYQWFLRTYPGLVGRISNKCIASFLGMTPVTLSRLRRVLREQNLGK